LSCITGKREHTEETKRKMSEAAKQRWAQAHAIAQLSDQVMALTARMQEFERMQQLH
jgi:NUMOD3 motif